MKNDTVIPEFWTEDIARAFPARSAEQRTAIDEALLRGVSPVVIGHGVVGSPWNHPAFEDHPASWWLASFEHIEAHPPKPIEGIGPRMRFVLDGLNVYTAEAAAQLGWPQHKLSELLQNWMHGEQRYVVRTVRDGVEKPIGTIEALISFARTFEVSLDWLAGGAVPRRIEPRSLPQTTRRARPLKSAERPHTRRSTTTTMQQDRVIT